MSIVANKFIPMSLADLSAAINALRDDISELKSLVAGSDTSAIAEDVSELQDKFNNLKTSFEQIDLNSADSLSANIEALTSRVDDLEEITTNFFGA